MIQNEEEYKEALEELRTLERKANNFKEQNYLDRGFPAWLVHQQKNYYQSRPIELANEISAYLKENPKAGYRLSRYRRYRRRNNNKQKKS